MRGDREGLHRLARSQPAESPRSAEETHDGVHSSPQALDTAPRQLDHHGARGRRHVAPERAAPHACAARSGRAHRAGCHRGRPAAPAAATHPGRLPRRLRHARQREPHVPLLHARRGGERGLRGQVRVRRRVGDR